MAGGLWAVHDQLPRQLCTKPQLPTRLWQQRALHDPRRPSLRQRLCSRIRHGKRPGPAPCGLRALLWRDWPVPREADGLRHLEHGLLHHEGRLEALPRAAHTWACANAAAPRRSPDPASPRSHARAAASPTATSSAAISSADVALTDADGAPHPARPTRPTRTTRPLQGAAWSTRPPRPTRPGRAAGASGHVELMRQLGPAAEDTSHRAVRRSLR
mmetsp:Transcript_105229/g.255463  ORF Transcript_105229/g.255463 Transcript_105229/m.255463 type:complete len:215 (+) Transcript_105229:1281-1925(+)